MKYRLTFLALILANVALAAWSQNWLAAIGFPANDAPQPSRAQPQIKPDVLQVHPQSSP